MRGRIVRRTLRRWAIVASAPILLLTGCTAGKEPQQVDVAAAFTRNLADPGFARHGELSGTVNVGDVTGSLEGSMDVDGADSSVVMTTTIGGAPTTVEAISFDGGRYERTDGGPWLRDDEPAGEPDGFAEWLATRPTVEEVGMETIDGRRLHHLRPTTPPPAGILGFDEDELTDAELSVDLFADDDGAPAFMSFFLSGLVPEQGATIELELLVELIGPADPILAPEEVWTTFRSQRRGYSVAYPEGWTSTSSGGADVLQAPGGSSRVVMASTPMPRDAAPGRAPDVFIGSLEREFGARRDVITRFEAGGASGKLATIHPTIQGTPMYVAYFVGSAGDRVYELLWISPAGTEEADRATFDGFLSSVEWTS